MLPEKKVKRIIEMMNSRSSASIPAIKPVLKLFELVMDEKTLDWLLRLGTGPVAKTAMKEKFHEMYGGSDADWDAFWLNVITMGFYQPAGSDNRNEYTIVPIFPGWVEMAVAGAEEPRSSQILDCFVEFWDTLKKANIGPLRYMDIMKNMKRLEKGMPPRLRAMVAHDRDGGKEITLNQPLTSQQAVLPAGDVYETLSRFKDELAVIHCFCRKHKTMHGGRCRLHLPVDEGCVILGPTATQMVESGVAKKLTYEQACDLMAMYDKGGAVHAVYHYGNNVENEEMVICNCCPDCCLLFKSYHEGGISKIFVRSYASPEMIDESRCVGCDRCGKVCPTAATYYDKKSGRLIFDYDKCIGCGQCVYQCKFDVRRMIADPRDVYVKTKKRSEAISID